MKTEILSQRDVKPISTNYTFRLDPINNGSEHENDVVVFPDSIISLCFDLLCL